MSDGRLRYAAEALAARRAAMAGFSLSDAFRADPRRTESMQIEAAGLLLDYSKNWVDADTMAALFALADACDWQRCRERMFNGERINVSEGRAALHTALRASPDTAVAVDGQPVMPAVSEVLQRMAEISERVRDGRWLGAGDETITDLVNIGIGGSELGVKMLCEALGDDAHPRLRIHFVSSVDGAHIRRVLHGLNPARSLLIVASKSFTTPETMLNARAARRWLARSGVPEAAQRRHLIAITANAGAAASFGVPQDQILPMWDWVGGRFSLWSAVGLPAMILFGARRFEELLAGAARMDQHFRQRPASENMPLIMAMLSVWYVNHWNAASALVSPYNHALRHLPAYLQQLEMESNGKRVRADGTPVDGQTAPVIWGGSGNNGQHAYYQMLHQGTQTVPVDLIGAVQVANSDPRQHRCLLANLLAQSTALMQGHSPRAEASGEQGDAATRLAAHRSLPGNRPSTVLLMRRLDAASLGALLALYEHKTFCEGVVWGINSFDQWGVELGKTLAARLVEQLEAPAGALPDTSLDSSTRALLARIRALLRDANDAESTRSP